MEILQNILKSAFYLFGSIVFISIVIAYISDYASNYKGKNKRLTHLEEEVRKLKNKK